ncbi:MAG: CoA transferase [Thermodesulfobacteriota bacterium]|jgi:crotonobetainyl-CoA:carnitine CoA-transferase CaiB-like acyl-CoA transferase
MASATQKDHLLGPYRVLDLTGETGFMCGKVLGDFGAEVILVEPPGGHPARAIGPFYKDEPHPEKSLFWFAFNTSKKGITLDLTQAEGQQLLCELVRQSDIVIESFAPGYLDALGVGYTALSAVKPDLIFTSITPYGQTGPRKDWKGTDLTLQARCGFQYLLGDPDRAPVRVSVPTVAVKAGIEAANATLFALFHRNATGEGQHVDVSIQAAGVWQMMNATSFPIHHGTNQTRAGDRYNAGFGNARAILPCADGYVTFFTAGGHMGAPTLYAVSRWMESEGKLPDFMRGKRWEEWDLARLATDRNAQQEMEELNETIATFLATKTKWEIFERAFKERILAAPVNNVQDLVGHPQPNARGFFRPLAHPELGADILYPGHWALMNNAQAGPRFRAPRIGEHNEEVYCRLLGYTGARVQEWHRRGIV